jgi:N-acetylmuramic acid 6-phosphate etherase
MIRLGKTFGNLMVDLRATNSKLRRRAIRIVQEATGLDQADAADVLRRSGDDAKTAIVAARAGIDPATARDRIAKANGSVRVALGESAPCPE